MIIGTYRPADALAGNHPLRGIVQELQTRSQCAELRLAPLAEEAIVEYLTARFAAGATGRSLLQELSPLLHRRTGGNPLFLVNIIDYLIRQGILVEETGQSAFRIDMVKALSEGTPDSLRQLIERQLERLPEPERRLLEVASVAGLEFAAAEAAAGLLAEQDDIEALCERLARAGQWLRATEVAEWPDGTISGRYSFLHAVHHEIVYAQLPDLRRVQLHRRIAERKEAAYGERVGEIAAELAVHFEKGRDAQRAVEYLTRAGENALQRSAHAEAIHHLTAAHDLLASLPESLQRDQQELRMLIALGAPLLATKGYAAAAVEATYLRAVALCRRVRNTPYHFPALWGLWAVYAVRPDHQKALELGAHLLDLTQQQNNVESLVQAHWAVGQPLLYMGRFHQAREHFEQGWLLYNRHRDRLIQAPATRAGQDPGVNCLAMTARTLWTLGYPDQALRKCQEALALAQDLRHPLSVGFALAVMTMIHQLRREAPEAQEKAEAAIAICREYGFAFYLALETIRRGWALAVQRQPEEGIAQLRQRLAALRATGAEFSLSHYLAALAEAYEKAGQIDKGLITLSEGLAVAEKHEERFDEAELYRLKGALMLQQATGNGQAVDRRGREAQPWNAPESISPAPSKAPCVESLNIIPP